jgi:hypothetical protein
MSNSKLPYWLQKFYTGIFFRYLEWYAYTRQDLFAIGVPVQLKTKHYIVIIKSINPRPLESATPKKESKYE